MITNKFKVFVIDRGINQKKNRKFLQQWAIWVDTSINRKNIRFIS